MTKAKNSKRAKYLRAAGKAPNAFRTVGISKKPRAAKFYREAPAPVRHIDPSEYKGG